MNSYQFGSLKSISGMPEWRIFKLILASLALSFVMGCANGPRQESTGAAQTKDQATDSDESEVRKRARLRLELALGYFDQGQTRVALDEVKQSLQQDPSYTEAYNLRGLIYMRLNDFRLAEESFRQSLAISSRDGNTLHNYGWLLCQQGKYAEANNQFIQALAANNYPNAAKTSMTQGICQIKAGQLSDAEASLLRSYALDPGNPITGYNLAFLMYKRGEMARAQFYIRRINNGDYANAESLWLGIKVERKLGSTDAMRQLADQLNKRFAQSRELQLYEKGSFDE